MIPKTKKLLAERILKNQRKSPSGTSSRRARRRRRFTARSIFATQATRSFPSTATSFPPDSTISAPKISDLSLVLKAHLDAFSSNGIARDPRKSSSFPSRTRRTSTIWKISIIFTQIFENAGFETEIGWYGPVPEGMTVPLQLKSQTGKQSSAIPLEVENFELFVPTAAGNFVPDLILLNNDFSSGYPKIFDGVRQPIVPSHRLGWHSRKKSEHFKHYNELAAELAQILDVDPWTASDRDRGSLARELRRGRRNRACRPSRRAHSQAHAGSLRSPQDHAQALRLREKQLRHLRHGDHGRPQRGRAAHDESPDQAQDERRQKQDAHSKRRRSGRRSDGDARRPARRRTRDLSSGLRADRGIPPHQYRKRRRGQSQLAGHGLQELCMSDLRELEASRRRGA